MARILMIIAYLIGFPLLIFGESIVGLPIMSIFIFLLLTLRLSMIKRLWWLVYVSGWLALWYHAWWWQTLVVMLVILVCSHVIILKQWLFGGLIVLTLIAGLLFGVLFVNPSDEGDVLLIGLQLIVASLVWWWLWRRRGSIVHSPTWYIR